MRSRIHSKKCSIIDINRNSDQAAVHLPGCLFILVHIKKPRQGLTGMVATIALHTKLNKRQ